MIQPRLPEKFLVLILVLLLATGILPSCRQEEDSVFPVIKILAPTAGTFYNVYDTIHVSALFTDDIQIRSLKVTLIDSENRPVLTPIEISPFSNPYTFTAEYPIDNRLLESGTYELQFQVSDGVNLTNAFVKIQVMALPKEFLFPVIVTRPSSTLVSAFSLLPSGQWNEIYSRQGDYIGSAINSPYSQLYISGASQAGFTSVDLSEQKISWSLAAQQLPHNHWFEFVTYQYPLVYISYYDGYVRGFDKTGNALFESARTDSYYPKATCLIGDYLAACLENLSTHSSALALYFKPGGNLKSLISPVPDIIALFPSDKNHLFTFGNKSGSGVIQQLDIQDGTYTELKRIVNDSIFAVSAMDAGNYIISGKNKLYWFRHSQNSLVEFVQEINKARLACEPLDMEVFAASGKQLFRYSFPEGILLGAFTTPDPVLDIHLLYNK